MQARCARWILCGVVFASLTFSAAGAADANCLSVCQDKANSCAAKCSEKSGQSFEDCQLGCAKLLFSRCIEQCNESGVVVWDDYEIRTPDETGEEK